MLNAKNSFLAYWNVEAALFLYGISSRSVKTVVNKLLYDVYMLIYSQEWKRNIIIALYCFRYQSSPYTNSKRQMQKQSFTEKPVHLKGNVCVLYIFEYLNTNFYFFFNFYFYFNKN